jgi:hypothetical protein
MFEELREYLHGGSPLKIPFAELTDPGDIREQLAVNRRKGLGAGTGCEGPEVGIDHLWIRECIGDVLSAGWIPSADEVLGICAENLTKVFTPSCQIITELSQVHGCGSMAQGCAKTIFYHAQGGVHTTSLQALILMLGYDKSRITKGAYHVVVCSAEQTEEYSAIPTHHSADIAHDIRHVVSGDGVVVLFIPTRKECVRLNDTENVIYTDVRMTERPRCRHRL